MAQVVQAKCPHCQNILRIPADWVYRPMRCKHCRQVFQAKQKPAVAKAPPAAPPPAVAAPAAFAHAPQAKAPPAAPGDAFAFDEDDVPADPAPRSRRRQGSRWKGVLVGVALLLIATVSLVVAGPYLLARLKPADKTTEHVKAEPIKPPGSHLVKPVPRDPEEPPPRVGEKPPPFVGPGTTKNPGTSTTKKGQPQGEMFPRRALAISVNDYWLANSLSYGLARDTSRGGFPGSSPRAVLNEFGNFSLKFPNTQLVELSDQAREPQPPLKPVIETAITDFLNTSREQDRIVILFAGHAVEMNKEAYLVPLEGDLEDPKTLIPLSWVYDKLKASKARQKLLILDLCRYDPARGYERPGSGSLGPILDAQLQAPPAGVQVWSSCVAEQQSYEFESGSLFLQALCAAMQERLPGFQEPGQGLPLDVLVPRVNTSLDQALAPLKLKQTTRLAGKEPDGGAPYNPAEPLPQVVAIKPPPQSGDMAATAAVQKIFEEIRRIPPPRVGRNSVNENPKVASMFPFQAKTLEEYAADYKDWLEFKDKQEQYPLRAAVVKAALTLEENANKFTMKEVFNGNSSAAVKKQVLKEQTDPGKAVFYLEDALEDLKKAGEERDKEMSKRWQAHYDYVMGRLKARLIYVMEYNYVLAQIRSDSLPPLENGASGYRLGSRSKAQIPEGKVKDWVKDVARIWGKIAKEYPDTPWAMMARRERLTVLGLEWRPVRD